MSVDTTSATAAAGVDPARAKIAGSIKQAASTTGASFEYLLATAKMESNFNPKAAATTSSARGLFQFIDQTWLGTVKEAGAHLGYGKYADAITKNPSGSYSVSDPDARAAIMKLRDDPEAASSMAAVLTQSNSFKLTGKIGRRPTDSELYMAHFMGVGGASKLIQGAEDNPNASAAQMCPLAVQHQRLGADRLCPPEATRQRDQHQITFAGHTKSLSPNSVPGDSFSKLSLTPSARCCSPEYPR